MCQHGWPKRSKHLRNLQASMSIGCPRRTSLDVICASSEFQVLDSRLDLLKGNMYIRLIWSCVHIKGESVGKRYHVIIEPDIADGM